MIKSFHQFINESRDSTDPQQRFDALTDLLELGMLGAREYLDGTLPLLKSGEVKPKPLNLTTPVFDTDSTDGEGEDTTVETMRILKTWRGPGEVKIVVGRLNFGRGTGWGNGRFEAWLALSNGDRVYFLEDTVGYDGVALWLDRGTERYQIPNFDELYDELFQKYDELEPIYHNLLNELVNAAH